MDDFWLKDSPKKDLIELTWIWKPLHNGTLFQLHPNPMSKAA